MTTGGAAILVIVSGPVVEQHGFEHGPNALGANCRANATVGRFAQMMRYFCGRGGVLQSHGTVGHPGRLSFVSPNTRNGMGTLPHPVRLAGRGFRRLPDVH